ncbi:MFS transporter [Pedobacter sp. HMF7647]|uniref:MFS transporter n=1 Tax=Hufsiella arboris TaxID=2695275 RepID=A0A7K1Y9Z5_9SPHI|nr:MFS transporter [Hufsiella arboris]MXV51392.1 MFS transporter [Hufsiella arboris]
MGFRTSEKLSDTQINRGLKYVVTDGVASEAMVAFTGGTFLVALAVQLGASNFQLGILASLPTFSNIFQLLSIWLVQRYKNRRAISFISTVVARFPLFLIGALPFMFTAGTSIQVLIFLLSIHYFGGSISGASWNSWMKDLIPDEKLGSFFSHRSRLAQIASVTLSLGIATALDYIKSSHPGYVGYAYLIMFIIGGLFGMLSAWMLARTPEPTMSVTNENTLTLFKKPLKDKNFRRLLIFNSFWAFALNLATPFFSVFMLKTIGLPISYVIALGIIGQISGIFSIKLWGRYTDKHSNKSIISLCAPAYIACILAMSFTSMPSHYILSLALLVLINIVSGISTSGINLALNNIGIKLAPKNEAMAYLSAKNMAVAVFSALAPLLGGLMADFFATHQMAGSISFTDEQTSTVVNVIHLQGWNYFFIFGGLLAMLSLRWLKAVRETGSTDPSRVMLYMRANMRSKIRNTATAGMVRNGMKTFRNREGKPAAGNK